MTTADGFWDPKSILAANPAVSPSHSVRLQKARESGPN